MAIIKVSTSVFSLIKTVERAIQKANSGDVILVAAGKYKEALSIQRDVHIMAKFNEQAIIEGAITIPKSVSVHFENMLFQPTSPIHVEGTITLKNCVVKGSLSNILLSCNGGHITAEKCKFIDATDMALALFKKSNAHFVDCYFENNAKAHILMEDSTIGMKDCELLNASHAIWLKSQAQAQLDNVKIHHHSGTQLIVQNQAQIEMQGCAIEHGEGNGIYAAEQAKIHIQNSVFQHHALPQLWMQNSELLLMNSHIQYGKESGIMLREGTEAVISNTLFADHKIANVQLTLESLLNMTNCHIYSCQGVGVQLKDKSIANFSDTVFADNTLPQLFLTENSICTLKNTTIKEGKQVGIFVEKKASCSIVSSIIQSQENTAITVIDAELFLLDSTVQQNKGNGVLSVNHARANIENSQFIDNAMPHIAGKDHAHATLAHCELTGGKGIFMVDHCQLEVNETTIKDGTGVQVEVVSHTKATINKSQISDGKSNGI